MEPYKRPTYTDFNYIYFKVFNLPIFESLYSNPAFSLEFL